MTARLPLFALVVLTAGSSTAVAGQEREPTPVRQSDRTGPNSLPVPLTLEEAARNDRWFGLGVRDVTWAPGGEGVYFRWNRSPTSSDLPTEDPWFLASPDGAWVETLLLSGAQQVPAGPTHWSEDRVRAAWVSGGSLYLFDPTTASRRILTLEQAITGIRMASDGSSVDVQVGEALYRYDVATGSLRVLAVRTDPATGPRTDAAIWLEDEQRELFEHTRRQDTLRERTSLASRSAIETPPQLIPVEAGVRLDQLQLSPDGRWLTFRAVTPSTTRPQTRYADYLDESGYTQALSARSKAGEPRDVVRLGVVPFDPAVPADELEIRWIQLPEAGDENTVPHGPLWSPDGSRGVVQFIGEDHEDVWIAAVDLESATARVLAHDHDEAWIGGPPVQANYLQPALMAWLPDGGLAFASERTGWSHLYRVDESGTVTPITEGAWEVRGARLSPDRSQWLLQASREHPSEDHLYVLPTAGGAMERITTGAGRHEGWWSPDGRSIAVVTATSTSLPDLYLGRPASNVERTRVTISGTDAFYDHPLVAPEMVEMVHPDGGPSWAALFRPAVPNSERSALIHVHGGGYRQFAHRGYSVYGYALHLGFIHYMLEQGYTVLDYDYRGGAGFGRDYRTDISESMGIKDTDGAAAAARWLVDNADVHPERIGIYGVSYGGFLTLMSLFRYPGVFGAGVARAAVTDWAHYSDGWTSRILGVPHENPDAYRLSSPIYYVDGLDDPLMITHGIVDDNVHFQDAARLIQRLIELEKRFDVMVYPVEPHTIQTEASRYDLLRRQAEFFDQHLRGIRR